LAKLIVAQMRKPLVAMQTFTPPPIHTRESATADKGGLGGASEADTKAILESVQSGGSLDISQILKVLPHRYPFLMIDRIVKIEGNKITGLKNITINEPYFQGHFPDHPIMPGVLQLEAIAQVAGILMLRQAENWGKLAYFMAADSVKWRKPVHPGDTLMINVELTKSRGKIGKAKAACCVNDEIVSEAEVTFMLVDANLT
jgi:UDP-3-O-[3-hydroxymyristoyl] N-acetylglucosamine deacetylase/3-hydroxyacyl-[acyl-carrier-protein] dehydratase